MEVASLQQFFVTFDLVRS